MLLKNIIAALALLLFLPTFSNAAPYVVYLGTSSSTSLTEGNTKVASTSGPFYLIVDLNDTSNYAVMQVNSTKMGTITGYPITGATSGQSNANFFGGIVAASRASGGLAVFTSGSQVTDGSNNTDVTRFYGTGDLNGRLLQIVPARHAALTVRPRVNGVTGAPVTFPPSAAIVAAASTYPSVLRGTQFGYTIAADGTITNATTAGSFVLLQNASLTSLANIGGEYTANKNFNAIQPVNVTGTITDALTAWLISISAANGYTSTIQ